MKMCVCVCVRGHTAIQLSHVALLSGARGGEDLGVNHAPRPVTLHGKGGLLVHLQILLL